MKLHYAAFVLAASLALGGAAMAQDKAAEQAKPEEQAEQRITLETATSLINYGKAKSDPLALLAGARMMASVPAKVMDAEGKAMDVGAVLDDAVKLSGDNEHVAALAADVRDDLDTSDRGMCYWQYQCYWNGYCQYFWYCY